MMIRGGTMHILLIADIPILKTDGPHMWRSEQRRRDQILEIEKVNTRNLEKLEEYLFNHLDKKLFENADSISILYGDAHQKQLLQKFVEEELEWRIFKKIQTTESIGVYKPFIHERKLDKVISISNSLMTLGHSSMRDVGRLCLIIHAYEPEYLMIDFVTENCTKSLSLPFES